MVIGGSYIVYRSITSTWTSEQNIDQYKMFDGATSNDPESTARINLINRQSDNQYRDGPAGRDALPNPPLILSQFGVPSASEEAYHHHFYTSVFGHDNVLNARPKESPFSSFWPTRSDLAIRQQTDRIVQQKRAELRKYYTSDKVIDKALLIFAIMFKQRKLQGLPLLDMSYFHPLNQEVTVLG